MKLGSSVMTEVIRDAGGLSRRGEPKVPRGGTRVPFRDGERFTALSPPDSVGGQIAEPVAQLLDLVVSNSLPESLPS